MQTTTETTRVGLVLGGGGSVGLAYHAGVLMALEYDLGWDPRTAEVIVGTSAGSIVAAALRAGVPASDLAALTVGARTRETPPSMARAIRRADGPAPPGLRSFVRPLRVPHPALLAQWMRRPWLVDPVVALASVVPDGALDLAPHLAWIDRVLGHRWPAADLWVCAVRQRDLRRVVLGRDLHASPSVAVAASCAVPGVFRPVEIDGAAHVDGGLPSPTNADVLVGRDLDLVIVVSPMSGRAPSALGLERLVRDASHRRVRRERSALERAGATVVALEPAGRAVGLMGLDMLRSNGLDAVVRESFLDTGDRLRSPAVAAALAPIGRAAEDRRRPVVPGPR